MNILIAGDSWGKGAYTFCSNSKRYIINHPGLEYYLTVHNHKVTNLSVPSYSNYDIYLSLRKANIKEYDFIMVFFTNPLRDLYSKHTYNFLNVNKRSLTLEKFKEFYNRLSIDYCKLLSYLNVKIHLLGGQNKIIASHNTSSNINIVLPSIREWLYPNYEENFYQGMCSNYLFKNRNSKDFYNNLDLETLDYILEMRAKKDSVAKAHEKYFASDNVHLNLLGHKKLSEYLLSNILPAEKI